MRKILVALFLIAFALWYAKQSYVGGIPDEQEFAEPIVYLSVFCLFLASVLRSFRTRRLDWKMAVFAAIAVVAGQLVWRDFIHPLHDFKLYAFWAASATVAIALLGIAAAFLEWRSVLKE